MRFTKMQGIGNDYVYVNCLEESVPDPPETARRISDRHFGVGSDGLILIRPCETADFEMEMYNADGSRSGMCGNGMRCVAKYVYDFGLTDKTALVIASGGRNYPVELFLDGGKAARVKVDMGRPGLRPEEIPVKLPGENVIRVPVTVGGKEYRMTCVSMGNPHCVVSVEDPDSLDLQKIGPDFENLPLFPERVNTEFIRVLNDHTVRMRVWERGAGETLA